MPAQVEKELVYIPVGDIHLTGDLIVPHNPIGLVIFSHGSGSSRHSSRNLFVARQLEEAGMATLLFDLLTEEEDQTYTNRFEIELLVERLTAVTDWIAGHPHVRGIPLAYFGASTGAAAALGAAAGRHDIRSVVSRGGRPDLALHDLPQVLAPVLLLVGDRDYGVIELNEKAFKAIRGRKELVLIHGATHLFEEPGTLEQVAEIATDWFKNHFK